MWYRFKQIAILVLSVIIGKADSCVQQCKNDNDNVIVRDTILVDVTQHGIIGDSVTDNTIALVSLVSLLTEADTTYWDLHFPAGRYVYTDNTWPTGLTYFRISGNGSQFQNITPTVPHGEDCQVISMRGPQRKKHPVHRYAYDGGSKFRQITAKRIQLLAPDSSFTCGDLVLLSGFEQQHEGYPPNPRYFEYKRITATDRKYSLLEFDTPLQFQYDAGWGDYAWGAPGIELKSGAPRILNLSRTDYPYPRHVEIRDLTLMPNPNCTISDALVLPGEVVILRNVHLDILYPSYSRKFVFIGGSIDQLIEFDKLVDTIYFENVHMRRRDNEPNPSPALAATGVHHLHIVRCTLDGPLRVSPRNLVVRSTRFRFTARDAGSAAVERYNDFFPVYTVFIDSIEIENTALVPNSIVGYDNINELMLPAPVDGTKCIPLPDDDVHRSRVLRSVDIGTAVHSPEYGTNGVVVRMHKVQAGDWCLLVQWVEALPGPVQHLLWSQVREITVHQNVLPEAVTLFSAGRLQRETLLSQLQKVAVQTTAQDN